MSSTFLGDCFFDGHRFVDEPRLLHLERGLIARIAPWAPGGPIPAGAVDCRGQTLVPGLIDAHCHLGRVGLFEPDEAPNSDAVVTNLRSALAAGVTTAGDMGCTAPLIATLRAHTDQEPAAGPAIRASGPFLTVPLGYPFDWMSPFTARSGRLCRAPIARALDARCAKSPRPAWITSRCASCTAATISRRCRRCRRPWRGPWSMKLTPSGSGCWLTRTGTPTTGSRSRRESTP